MKIPNIPKPTIEASIQAAIAQLIALGRSAVSDTDFLAIYKLTNSVSAVFLARVEEVQQKTKPKTTKRQKS